ncbi:hypothetical protein [Nocardia africana]
MATMVPWSRTSLSAACSGKTLPTWECTEAILTDCCQVDEAELNSWREYWLLVQRAEDEQGLAGRSEAGWGLLLPEFPTESDSGTWRPRPDLVSTFDDLACELRRFKVAAGDPPLRILVKDMRQHVFRGAFSQTTLSEVFTGKRRPNIDVYRALLRVLTLRSNALHSAGEQGRPWKSEHEWIEAWSRAEFARSRPHQPAPSLGRPSSPEFSLSSWVIAERLRTRESGSALDALAGAQPEAAAEVLFGMGPREISAIIMNLDKAAANEVLAAVLELHRKQVTELTTPAPKQRRRRGPVKMSAGRTQTSGKVQVF